LLFCACGAALPGCPESASAQAPPTQEPAAPEPAISNAEALALSNLALALLDDDDPGAGPASDTAGDTVLVAAASVAADADPPPPEPAKDKKPADKRPAKKDKGQKPSDQPGAQPDQAPKPAERPAPKKEKEKDTRPEPPAAQPARSPEPKAPAEPKEPRAKRATVKPEAQPAPRRGRAPADRPAPGEPTEPRAPEPARVPRPSAELGPAPVQAEGAELFVKELPAPVPGAPPVRRGPARPGEVEPAPSLNELLGQVDPTMFNLSGAELQVEVVGDTVVLQGDPEDLRRLQLLIDLLDVSRPNKVLRVVTVTQRDANEIARSAQEALRKVWQTANQRTEDEVSITALSSNILLVAALPDQIDFVVEVIEQVDAVPPALGKVEQMVFHIKNRRAVEAAEQLKEIIDKIRERQGARGAEAELQIIPNESNNSIMVLAPESERETIQKLLDEIDVEPIKGFGEVELAFYPLLHSEANELADVIRELLATEQAREETTEAIKRLCINKVDPTTGQSVELPPINLERNLKIIPDEGTNSLIVATVQENIDPMGELIRLLDGVPMATDMGVRLFPLRFADAATVRDLLSDLFDQGKDLPQEADGSGDGRVPKSIIGQALVYNVSILADERTNVLIVSGRQEQIVLVQMVVDELDVPARALKFPLRFVPLQYADATRVGKVITDLVDKRIEALEGTNAGDTAIERERVFLTVDIRSNTLIVSASDENYDEIVTIVEQLDSKPTPLFDQIRVVPCGRLSATDLKDKIDELWQRKQQLRQETEQVEDTPVLVADGRSNALVIASSVEDFEEIQALVTTLSAQPLIESTRIFPLQYADATVLANMLDELFDGMQSASESDSFQAPTIIPDPRGNSLIIAGMQDVMERAADLICRLDVEAGPLTATFAIYPLQFGSAAKLAARMQELFDTRREGRQTEQTPVAVLADEATNSLICLASKDDHAVLIGLLELLDKPSTLARQFEIFPLKYSKAETLAEKIESLFTSQAEGASGRTDAAGVEADLRTNALIVWASPTEMENIREVIHRLDTASPVRDMMVKMVRLQYQLAEDFAQLLEETLLNPQGGNDEEAVILSFQQTQPDGSKTTRKLLRQDIQLKPDRRTNALMVMAPAESMDLLQSMIEDFDQTRPVQSEIRLFPLVNSDAEAMVEQLTSLFEGEGGGAEGETAQQLVFGLEGAEQGLANVGQKLRFSPDRRTNTIIAAGAEVDLRMVEELVRYLDGQDTEERINEVVKARFRKAPELATAVRSFVEQEQQPLAEIDDQISRLRRAEKMVSVEAVGDEESSNSLLLGVSPRYYQQTMRLIDELDRPEPQVMLRVLIAEVQLQENLALGMEFAGQDLRFSEHAVLHPNTGLPIGPDFDSVIGTTLGAAGLGGGQGLSFTMTGEDFSFVLRTLQSNSRLEVLSRPVVMVQNGQEGKITIADQIPMVTNTTVNTQGGLQSSVGSQDVGIVLTAKPQISPDGYVTIQIKQEISNFSGDTVQLTEGLSQPFINDRTVESWVTVRDGETVVIGGLITDRKSQGETKVPLLGDVPLLGALFRTTNITHQKTELLVVLNVNVLRTDEDRRRLSLEERDKTGLLGNMRKSPLMEGLRIVPDETLLGPGRAKGQPAGSSAPATGAVPASPPVPATSSPNGAPGQYGPKPKRYGPAVEPPPAPTTQASAGGATQEQVQAVLAQVRRVAERL